MAYKIRYGVNRHDRKKRGVARRIWLPFLLAACLLVTVWLIEMKNISLDWLLPGDPEVTASALESLRENLAAGEPFGEAVTAFCREIINGAALAE